MEYIGIVIFMLSNIGSMSEGDYPYLYMGNAKLLNIELDEDKPFTFPKLKEYDMKKVKVIGDFNDNETFIIKEIVELETDEDQKTNKGDSDDCLVKEDDDLKTEDVTDNDTVVENE